MLTHEDNELLTRVGPGTPMGNLLRQFWHPVLWSYELPEADCPPLRVRLLGEDLVVFRDSNGDLGLMAENCPHRGASMFFGRNEEAGLRCVYHGWKFDLSGDCVDMPNEPAESNFKHKIHIAAYLARERNGVVWMYMGDRATAPGLPEIEWNMVPPEQVYVSKRVEFCNWVQGLEGDIDSAHAPFLHGRLDRKSGTPSSDKSPRIEAVNTEFGVAVAAQRTADDGGHYYRINEWLWPYYTLVPPGAGMMSAHIWVPIDDENHLSFVVSWTIDGPFPERTRQLMIHGIPDGRDTGHVSLDRRLPANGQAHSAWRSIYNTANDYGINWERQRTTHYSGLPGIWAQDAAMQESMGAIFDRTKEHLASTDLGIIQVRRRLVDAARLYEQTGELPAIAQDPALYRARAVSVVIPEGKSWVEDALRFAYVEGSTLGYPAGGRVED